ncbi:hypothetical protein, partial [Fulvivirga lutimaris]|uniref:hypothetical protein n=1 Tax=Fulvivirga lutimaris TaxID=1819566 RepID=UPI0016268FFC
PTNLSTVRMGSVDANDNILTISAFNKGFHIVDYIDNQEINHLKLSQNAKSIKAYRLNAIFLDKALNKNFVHDQTL